MTYSLNPFKNDFYKKHTNNLSKHKFLEKKRKELEQKAKILKQASGVSYYSKHMQISLNSKSPSKKRRSTQMQSMTGSVNPSPVACTGLNSVYKNYWKRKTAKYLSSKKVFKDGKAHDQNKLFQATEKFIMEPTSISSLKSFHNESKPKNATAKLVKKTKTFDSFSK